MTQKQQRSLKNLLIIPHFQGSMVFFMILAGFICTIFNAILYYRYVVDSYKLIFKFSSLTEDFIEARYIDLYDFGLILCVVTLIITLAIALWGLFVTHRAAGSAYHFKQVFMQIKSGDSDARVYLRKKDEFRDIADEFNSMMDSLQNK